jgi:hypothetical protein
MTRLSLIACLLLVGCGAEGPPQKPAEPGVTVSGDAQIGVVVK